MPDPSWLGGALAIAVLAAAVYSVSRVLVGALGGRRVHYDVDISHALMGACMAGMFVAGLEFVSAAIWQAVFAVVIAWFSIRAIAGPQSRNSLRRGLLHQTGHLLSVAAMLYMLQAVPPASSDAGAMKIPEMPMAMALPGTARAGVHPRAVSILLAALLVGYAVLAVGRVRQVARGDAPAGTDELPLAPRAAAACEVVMCAAMAVTLVTMI